MRQRDLKTYLKKAKAASRQPLRVLPFNLIHWKQRDKDREIKVTEVNIGLQMQLQLITCTFPSSVLV